MVTPECTLCCKPPDCGAAEVGQSLWQLILSQVKVTYVSQPQPARTPHQPPPRVPVEDSL